MGKTVPMDKRLLAITFQAPYTAEYQCLAQMRDSGKLGRMSLINGSSLTCPRSTRASELG